MKYEIHPTIGIARLGGSDRYFLGPEPDCDESDYRQGTAITDPQKLKRRAPRAADDTALASYRDGTGKLLRQAARFRLFAVERDADGTITSAREVPASTRAEWSVQLANRKAAAQKFKGDGLRNPSIMDSSEREERLVIKGGRQPVTATAAGQQPIEGKFNLTIPVELGDAWTQGARLYVLGGRGRSGEVAALHPPPPGEPLDFANNDGWYDDTSDGVVSAKVTIGSDTFDAEPARVIVAPFDFAPEVDSFVTLYDIAFQASAAAPTATNFYKHILPVLQRVRTYRWVNAPTMRAETQDRHTSWRDIAADLADKNNANGSKFRRMLFAHLPHPEGQNQGKRAVLMPRLFDDEYRGVLPLTWVMYHHFDRWAQNNFDNSTAIEGQFTCEALDRVALESCSGGPFYPGMETSRIMRETTTYDRAFHIAPSVLPGEITQGLAIPWQADFYQCQMELDRAWWPATRPDHVFLDQPEKKPDSQSEEMVRWDAGIDNERDMVRKWAQLGIVRPRYVDTKVPGSDPVKDPSGVDRGLVFVEEQRELPR